MGADTKAIRKLAGLLEEAWIPQRYDLAAILLRQAANELDAGGMTEVERLEAENATLKADRAERLAEPCICEWQGRAEDAEADNARLNERLENKVASLRTEIAAKMVAYRDLERLEAENARLREAMAWQPIKTAPTNGTSILGCQPGWADAKPFSFVYAGTHPMGWRGPSGMITDWMQPTLWMPWPMPPPAVGINVGVERYRHTDNETTSKT